MIQFVGMYLVPELCARDILTLCFPLISTLAGTIQSLSVAIFLFNKVATIWLLKNTVRQLSDNQILQPAAKYWKCAFSVTA